MSQENVEVVARGYEHFGATRDFRAETVHPDFVWDMSKFRDWPEQQTYLGLAGVREFVAEWTGAWDDWELGVEALLDADDKLSPSFTSEGARRRPAWWSIWSSPKCGPCGRDS
jgi:hypothetical protein